MEMTPIAHIETDLPQKFGIPRNSFLAPHLQGRIVFEPEFALPQAVAGLEEFSHLWLLWEFENGTPGGTAADIAMDTVTDSKPGTTAKWTPTVRPPRLGGSERRGVFATRSPFRPNPIGLTCVKLDRIEIVDGAPVIHVLAADLRDGTPIFDIKPYIPFADSHPEATGGWTDRAPWQELVVDFPFELQGVCPGPQATGPSRGAASGPAPCWQQARARARVPFGLRGARRGIYCRRRVTARGRRGLVAQRGKRAPMRIPP